LRGKDGARKGEGRGDCVEHLLGGSSGGFGGGAEENVGTSTADSHSDMFVLGGIR